MKTQAITNGDIITGFKNNYGTGTKVRKSKGFFELIKTTAGPGSTRLKVKQLHGHSDGRTCLEVIIK